MKEHGIDLPLTKITRAERAPNGDRGRARWRTTSSGVVHLLVGRNAAPIRPAPGVVHKLLDNGYLELVSEATGRRYFCHPVGAAMWISLQDNDGQLDIAAQRLAVAWEADEDAVRADMGLWVDELCDAGLLRPEP